MDVSREWRRGITIWVAMACFTAVVCCWLLSTNPPQPPQRYQYIETSKAGIYSVVFDKQAGRLFRIQSQRGPAE